jgi:Flp pilus assembly protein TadB
MSVTGPATDRVRLHLAAGVPLAGDLELSPRVRRAIEVAGDTGASVLAAVDAAGDAEDDAARARHAVEVASAQSRTVAAGLVIAPVLLVPIIGRLTGTSMLAFYTSPTGVAILIVALGLLGLGAVVAGMLVRRLRRPSPVEGLEEAVELVATALNGGAGVVVALRRAADRIPRHADALRRLALDLELGVDRGPSHREVEALHRLRAVLVTASEVGASSASTLRRLARDLRAAELTRVLAMAERLPAQLTFPTTLLLLPATVLLIAAPLIVTGLAGLDP